MSDSKGSLKVDIDQLSTLGDNLKKSDFDSNFEKLKSEMSKITDSWLDLEGEHFREVFESFVTDAKKISDCVELLGDFASKMANSYQGTLDSYSAEMKSVWKE